MAAISKISLCFLVCAHFKGAKLPTKFVDIQFKRGEQPRCKSFC